MNPQTSQMDNDVINLAKAIRQTESGGDFNAKGGSGESGAYQWMPDTWKAHAGSVLGNPNAEMTPSNQNAVAYKTIKTWKDQGLNPAQIAAKWNSGSEVGWENKRGVNSAGVQYDVPRYVKSVTDAYQKVKVGSAVGMDPNNPSSVSGQQQAPVLGPEQPEPEKDGFLKSVAKGIISPVATMIARPFQAGAELLGASAETVNKYTKGNFGDWVAPVPQNFSDVKKDVGRGIQTAALGLGPVSGGAAFGTGMSLEQGNDLASWDTLAYTVGGAAFGKAADVIGRPLLSATGTVVGKITPEVLKTVAMGGAKAVEKFMAQNKILPDVISKGINRGAEGLEKGLNAPFKAGGDMVKAPFVQNDGKVISAREKALQDLEEKYAQLRANVARDPVGTAASRGRVAKSNVLTEEGMINEDGVIIGASRASEAYEAEAIGQGNRVVRQLLDREGVALDLNVVQREMERVMRETFDGAELTKALKQVQREIDGLRIKRPNGRITLSELHDNKISSRPKGKDYDDPSKAKMKKAVSRTYRETIEKNSKENIGEINKELQKFYDDSEYIANLQGKRIESGKLGKAVARIGGALGGAVVGGAIGGLPGVAAGSYVGGIVSSKLAGKSLQKAFGKPTKLVTPKSKVIGEAVTRANAPRNQLALPAPSGKTPIPLQPPKGKPSPGSVKAQSYVDRDPKTGKFRKVYLSGDAAEVSKVSEQAYKSTVANGGVTISLEGKMPSKGLAYAPYKGTERIIPEKDFNAKHIETYKNDHAKELEEPGNHLGMWVDEGKVYMDISKVGDNSPETLESAMKASQLAVFDLESFETVTLGEIKNGRYIRTYGKTTNNNGIDKGEILGGGSKGGDGKLPEVSKDTQAVSSGGVGKVGEGRVGGGKVEKVKYKQFGKQLRKQIDRDLISNKSKAVVIDSDTIKKAHPDYDPNKPNLLHDESSALSKELTKKAVDEDTSGLFRVTGGGAGSGKTEAVLRRIRSQPSVIFDGVLGNFDSAVTKIDYALSKGKRVEIYPVYAPIELATLFNKLRSRSVPDAELVAGHYGFRDTIPQLIAKYGNKIKIKPYENTGFGVKPRKLSQKRWEAKEIVNNKRMSRAEVEKANAEMNELIEINGLDWTKSHINDILKKKYG